MTKPRPNTPPVYPKDKPGSTTSTNGKLSRGNQLQLRMAQATTLHWLHWTVVALSLVLTLCAYWFSNRMVAANTSERFHHEAGKVIELVVERMGHYEDALWGGVALIDASAEVTHDEWVTYTESTRVVDRYPGIHGLGVINQVAREDLGEFLLEARTWDPEFQVHPKHTSPELWPITFIQPAETNAKAVGLDVAFEIHRYEAIQKARDTGMAQVTGPIILVQDQEQTPGFLFYAPFYQDGSKPETVRERRESVVGVAYAPFVVKDFLQGTLAKESRDLRIQIRDAASVLYDELDSEFINRDQTGSSHSRSTLSMHRSVEMFGRTWTFEVQAHTAFATTAESAQPYMILFGGVLIDSMLLVLFVLLTKSNRRALHYADLVTADLIDNKARLEASNHDLEQFAYVASHDLKAPLRVIGNLSKWIQDDLEPIVQGKPLTETVTKSIQEKLSLVNSRTLRLDALVDSLLMYSKSGSEHHQAVEVDTKALVDGIGELVQGHGLFQLTTDEDLPSLISERPPLEAIFQNLVSNAIKHHDQNSGTIHVSGFEEGDFVTFSVADDGPGIDPKYKDRIFELFSTLQPKDVVEGSGMGLAFVKKLVEDKHGSIWLQDNPNNRGATIRFTWPKQTS